MIWAILDNQRIEATPKQKALCPLCNQDVISKCGFIKIWHWAHKQQEECDSFGEPETEWHINWKNQFPKECQEVIIKKCVSDYCNDKKYHAPCNHVDCNDCDFVIHKADIKTKDKKVIEFQNSSISSEQIEEREKFYNNMIWILNGKTIAKNLKFFKQRYKWNWFPKSWQFSKKQIYIDLGSIFLYKLDSINSNGIFYKISKEAFIVQNGGNPWKK